MSNENETTKEIREEMCDGKEKAEAEEIDSNKWSEKTAEDEVPEKASWEGFHNWLHCVCVITFDLELGQALESIYPKDATLTKQEISNICYLAFPDSNSGCMGDTTFTVRLPSQRKDALRPEHVLYNKKCPASLKIDEDFFWGYVYFRQVKDPSVPRGYLQKSILMLSYLPFVNLFSRISSLVVPEYFDHGEPTLEAVCYDIERWPPPQPGTPIILPILGSVFQTYIPHAQSYAPNPSLAALGDPKENNYILINVEEINMFEIIQPVLSHIHLLWELVITCEPVVVMASSPILCSQMVLALTRLIAPLQYCGDYRPYFTIHDGDFKQYTSRAQGPPFVILGVTNPFFNKTFHHWPHTIQLSDDVDLKQKHKLKKSTPTKMIESSSGLYTNYKPFLQKDKHIIKKLMSGVSSKRPSEVQSVMLRRHFFELTNSFTYPLERYIASLLPLQKDISPFKSAPTLCPFNPDDFFSTLESAGPQLTLNNTGITGDWVGLYKKFFRSPNFKAWFNKRYTDLTLTLQARQLETLANADLKIWVPGRPEVEVVDMVLRLKNKINKCEELDIPVTTTVKEQLSQRLDDLVDSLPDDLKNILKVS